MVKIPHFHCTNLIPGQETKIQCAAQCGQNKQTNSFLQKIYGGIGTKNFWEENFKNRRVLPAGNCKHLKS